MLDFLGAPITCLKDMASKFRDFFKKYILTFKLNHKNYIQTD